MSDFDTPDVVRARALLRRVLVIIRDAWLIVGFTLVLAVGVEFLYRAQGSARRALRGESLTPSVRGHPYENEPWFAAFDPNRPLTTAVRYDPYRGFWPTSYRDPYITIDSNGLRRVALRDLHAAAPQRRVFLFGGSAMWGYTARDAYTIPARLDKVLRQRGYHAVEVVNFAQSSFNATQEVVTLLHELRSGNVPDVVVFYDGNNDVSSTFQNGVAGRVLNQNITGDRWVAIRRGSWGQIADLKRHSLVVERLTRMAGRPLLGQPVSPDADAVCDDVAEYYRNLTRVVEGLGEEFRFAAAFFWQPMLATSHKARSAWERTILEWGPGYDRMIQRCTASVASLMNERTRTTFVPLHALFDADSATAFVDNYGHTTERANARIAERIADVIIPMLRLAPGDAPLGKGPVALRSASPAPIH